MCSKKAKKKQNLIYLDICEFFSNLDVKKFAADRNLKKGGEGDVNLDQYALEHTHVLCISNHRHVTQISLGKFN
jgi:hypothetical protein